MKYFLHAIENFRIEWGDALSELKFIERDRFIEFDVILTNPPYSINGKIIV
jgi:type I restriction enzyme M protein